MRRYFGACQGGGYGSPKKILSKLPGMALLIDQGEGLDLRNDDDTTRFAQGIVDRALKLLDAHYEE
jgi:hypothetical protein